ncbi:hypothetical protein [Aetokthonos hydrillicola]|uniref:hypothetical protein n=1 Tax=Aetokthonos hydrillicola TaxID=1550245 RepID=UPI001B16B461|nr:hypothetical protein [Aetokthonos hydrillicola CCALA 1050]MBW4590900.1 hypothetical protein [Aetokthonos hydrillicola CCALA 1050]
MGSGGYGGAFPGWGQVGYISGGKERSLQARSHYTISPTSAAEIAAFSSGVR